MPPPEYRNTEASDQGEDLEADSYPVPDWGGVSMGNPARRVEKQPVQKITAAVVHDFSLDQAIPYSAVAIDAQIDRDDAGDNFIKENSCEHLVAPLIHGRPRRINRQGRGSPALALMVWVRPIWVWSIAGMITVTVAMRHTICPEKACAPSLRDDF